MQNTDFQEFLLLQMADSAFPTGAFAYSAGLEAMVEFGLVQNEEELAEYIYEFSRQAIAFELPFLNSFYVLAEQPETLKEAAQAYHASFVSAAMYEASLNLGKNWMRILEDVIGEESAHKPIGNLLREQGLLRHFLLVSTLSLKRIGFDQQRIRTFYLSSLIRDQVSAAIRLGVIGPMQGHAVQFAISSELAPDVAAFIEDDYRNAAKTGFITDVAQMLQQHVYSKLFKN